MKTNTTPATQARAGVIDAAIVKALKASEAARSAYAKTREVCAATEAQELLAHDADEMQPYWKAEGEAFKSADEAAKAAMQAGMEVAAYVMDDWFGLDAMAAATRAFQAAAEWF